MAVLVVAEFQEFAVLVTAVFVSAREDRERNE